MAISIPYTFVSGTTILSGEVNSNFSTLGAAAANTGGTETISGTWTFSAAPTIAGTLTLSGGKVAFPATQSASSDVNTLDDYEEGTWTPALGGSGGQSGQVYSSQAGVYVKIGKQVFASGRFVLSTLGTLTDTVRITGLPFTADSSGWGTVNIGLHDALTTNVVWLGGYIDAGQSYIILHLKTAAAATTATVAQADLSNTTQLIFSVTYRASA